MTMDYKIYPFKRYKKFRLYVEFIDSFGQKITRSTGATYPLRSKKSERMEANKQAQKRVKEIIRTHEKKINRGHEPIQTNPTLSRFLEADYYPYLQTNRRKGTLVSYRNALNHFLRICGDRRLSQYKRIDIEKYKHHRLKSDGVRKVTINIEIRGIKAAFSWAYKHDILDKHPLKGQGFLFDAKAHRRAFKDMSLTGFLILRTVK